MRTLLKDTARVAAITDSLYFLVPRVHTLLSSSRLNLILPSDSTLTGGAVSVLPRYVSAFHSFVTFPNPSLPTGRPSPRDGTPILHIHTHPSPRSLRLPYRTVFLESSSHLHSHSPSGSRYQTLIPSRPFYPTGLYCPLAPEDLHRTLRYSSGFRYSNASLPTWILFSSFFVSDSSRSSPSHVFAITRPRASPAVAIAHRLMCLVLVTHSRGNTSTLAYFCSYTPREAFNSRYASFLCSAIPVAVVPSICCLRASFQSLCHFCGILAAVAGLSHKPSLFFRLSDLCVRSRIAMRASYPQYM
ncbi:hypothetical protein R3P38DRAFT_3257583 [Favolaschia claudopus]|uniref:Uncharacterized protein n=1 Tax=Favolaschia claudopus TaxID=2862362 RepID=A0AAW0DGD8_9AGAR